MKWLKQIAIFVAVIAGVLGWKFYNKSQLQSSTKTTLVSICASEQQCLAAIEDHYDSCFDSSYSLGSRFRSGGLDSEKLANCINNKSGQPWFAVDQKN
jgi:hypothetical protein